MYLRSYVFHLRARNLSPRSIKATEEYVCWPMVARFWQWSRPSAPCRLERDRDGWTLCPASCCGTSANGTQNHCAPRPIV